MSTAPHVQPSLPLQRHFPHASALVHGAMNLGAGWHHEPLTEAVLARAQSALEAALAAGITVFDHADIYMHGQGESALGALLAHQPSVRDRVVLQSKCGIRFADDHGPKRYDLSAVHIEASVEQSLRRLRTTHLDLLLLHRPDPLMVPDEVASGLTRLRSAGKLRHWGVSNMHAAQVAALSGAMGEGPAVNQIELSLSHRQAIEVGTCFNNPQAARYPGASAWVGWLEDAAARGVQIQAWSPLSQGLYTRFESDDTAAPAVLRTRQRVRRLAQAHGCAPEAIVLAWLLRLPSGVQPVIGSTDPARIRACGEAPRVQLSREDWYALYEDARGEPLP